MGPVEQRQRDGWPYPSFLGVTTAQRRLTTSSTRTDRPEHKHHRDLTPVTALDDDCLLQVLVG